MVTKTKKINKSHNGARLPFTGWRASRMARLLLAAGLLAGGAAQAAPNNSFSVGILGTGAVNVYCLNSSLGVLSSLASVCDSGSGGPQAGVVSYTPSGARGSWMLATGPNSLSFGANGTAQLAISSAGLSANNVINMTSHQINALANGTVSTDAINLGQLATSAQGVAAALGGGATGNSNGTVSAPSYTLSNANAITSSSGALNNVGGALIRVDSALGALNTSVLQNTTQINAINNTLTDAVMYDTPAHNKVTFVRSGNAPVTLTNVAAANLNAGSSDAVNGAQLYATNQSVSSLSSQIGSISGASVNAVLYDTSAHSKVTLGNAGTPVAVTNMAAGALNSTSTDAVNGAQLYTTNQNVSGLGSQITTINSSLANAVLYDTGAHNKVTLGNAGTPVTVTNVAAGALNPTSSDAVNGAQLYTTNQNVSGLGSQITTINSSLANAVLYDTGAHNKVTLGNAGTPVTVTNVAAGALNPTSADAVNGAQLYTTNQNVSGLSTNVSSLTTQVTSINGTLTNAVLYDTAGHTSVTLGNVGTPVTVGNVAAGALNSGSHDAVNGSQLYTTNQNVAGLNSQISAINGSVADAVLYDTAAHTSVTLGNAGTPVTVGNVAAGALNSGSHDAVNGSQLYATNQNVAGLNSQISTINGSLADAVLYDTSAHSSVTLGNAGTPVTVTNVAAGALNSTSSDAVNGSQLYSTNQNVSGLNSQISTISGTLADAVLYDTSAHTSVTLGNVGTPVTVTNVAGGALNSTSTDAVNGAQLYSTNQNVAGLNSQISTINGTLADAVLYDTSAHTSVTLGNAGTPVTVTNVAGGALNSTSSDAVNGAQLYATNQDVAQNSTDISSILSGGGIKYFHANSTLADSQATGLDAVAIGGNAQATADNSVALGANSTTTANLGAAAYNPGGGTIAGLTPVGEVSVGSAGAERRITNLAAGAADTDAVNVSQLRQVTGAAVADAVMYDSPARTVLTLGGSGASTPVLLRNVAPGITGTDAVNLSQLINLQSLVNNLDTQVNTIVNNGGPALPYISGNSNGDSANAANSGTSAGVAIGYNSRATGEHASVLGQNAAAGGRYGLAVGNDSYAAGDNDTAIGGNAKVYADGSLAAGANATVSAAATNAVAVGADASVTAASATAVGQGARATATGSVALGQDSLADRPNTVSVGVAGGERQVTNVAPGVQPTDAVNVSQLQGVSSQAHAYTDQQVGESRRRASAGTAAAIAIANLPQPYEANKSMVSFAVGGFDGESGYALGVSHTTASGHWVFKAAATANSRNQYGGGIGAGFQW